MEYKYFSVEFYYPGPYTGYPDDDDDPRSVAACKRCLNASHVVEQAMRDLGWTFRHEYEWSDGSLYKFVRFDDPSINADRVRFLLSEQLSKSSDSSISVTDVFARDANTDPDKAYYKTLRDYFQDKKS